MDVHMSSSCDVFMQQGTTLLRSNTWQGFFPELWFDITHKNKDTQQTLGPIECQRDRYILTPPVMCSQQFSVLHWMNLHWITLQSSTMFLLLKKYRLVEVTYLLIRFNKTKFFPWNTKNAERCGISKKNTHTTTHLEEGKIGKG